MTGAAAIEVVGLRKDYQGLRPLRITALTVRHGDRVALSGLDATAAEVFVNLLNGAILPDEGDVSVFGKPTHAIVDQAEWFACLDRFGLVTPRAVLLDSCTVRQNLALPMSIELDELPSEIVEKTTAIAREVAIPAHLLETPVHQLPAQWRVHVHLGKALAGAPEILLLEHPTTGVPPAHVAAFAGIVAHVVDTRGLTLVAITEDTTLADLVAKVHYRLQAGSGVLVNARGWRRWMGQS